MARKKLEEPREKLKHICDFDWASVSMYLTYISTAIGLVEMSSHRVVYLPLARLGPDKALKQKELTLRALNRNISALARFIEGRKSDLTGNELAVLRGLYMQYRGNVRTVKDHIDMINHYKRSVGVDLFDSYEEAEDGLQF